MKKEIAELWMADLRNPDNTQQKKSLANSERTAHCCLGRLCEVAIENGVPLNVESTFDNELEIEEGKIGKNRYVPCTSYNNHAKWLPAAVVEWAGMQNDCPYFRTADGKWWLTKLDDNGVSFEKIADYIETHWADL